MRASLSSRFWAKVKKGRGCWTWTGGKSSEGYGRMRIIDRKTGERFLVLPHRVSYLLNVGDIPSHASYHGMCVCHRCDNPSCVRPSHLFLGTHSMNVKDSFKKGRSTPPNVGDRYRKLLSRSR